MVARWRGSVLAALVALASAAREQKSSVEQLHPAEVAHQRYFWHIGQGFEGTASDWTEYVVWLIGVIGVFYYMANPNARRNVYADYDEHGRRYEADGDETADEMFGLSDEEHTDDDAASKKEQ